MATITIDLPEPLAAWVEQRVRDGAFASTNHYLAALVAHDRDNAPDEDDEELSLDDLRRIVDESRASGISDMTLDEIFQQALSEVRARGLVID